jgi:hypothetical protein
VFRGPEFEQKEEYKKFANLLLDILSTLPLWRGSFSLFPLSLSLSSVLC